MHLCYVRLGCVRRPSASLVAPRDGCRPRPVLVWLPTAVVLRRHSHPLCRCQVALLPPCGVASVRCFPCVILLWRRCCAGHCRVALLLPCCFVCRLLVRCRWPSLLGSAACLCGGPGAGGCRVMQLGVMVGSLWLGGWVSPLNDLRLRWASGLGWPWCRCALQSLTVYSMPLLSAFAVLLYTSATWACAFGEAHGAFVLVSGLDCFVSVPRPLSFCHCPARGPCCLCLVARRPLWCCAASGGPSLPCCLRGHAAVDGAMLRIYTCVSGCWIWWNRCGLCVVLPCAVWGAFAGVRCVVFDAFIPERVARLGRRFDVFCGCPSSVIVVFSVHLCLTNLGIAIRCGTLQHIPAHSASLYFHNCAPRRCMSSGKRLVCFFLSLCYIASLQSYGHCYVAIALHLNRIAYVR